MGKDMVEFPSAQCPGVLAWKRAPLSARWTATSQRARDIRNDPADMQGGPTPQNSRSGPGAVDLGTCSCLDVCGAAVALASKAMVVGCQRQSTHKFSVPWRTSFVEQLSLLCRTVAVVPRVQTSRVNRMWAMRKNDRVVGFSSQSARFVGVLHCETTPSARRRAHHAGRAASTALPRGVLRSRCHHCKQHLFLQARLRCHLFCRIS